MAKGNDVVASTEAYEEWLEDQLKQSGLGEDLVQAILEEDIVEKHEKMSSGGFPFLRATYWRWAETAHKFYRGRTNEPEVLAVGDIHLENYGVWRDQEGRLVWGVNDFDEAEYMPYGLDIVRLAVSTALAPGSARVGRAQACAIILEGYGDGLKDPAPFVLDRDHAWLREQFDVDHTERADFWAKIAKKVAKVRKAKEEGAKSDEPPPSYRKAVQDTIPEQDLELDFWRSSAGTGSLGRPRWRAHAIWRGAPVVREVKAIVPSAWAYAHDSAHRVLSRKIAAGRFRAPDPWYRVDGKKRLVVRRLSANSRKLEMEYHGDILLDPRMLGLMGHELANIHLGTATKSKKAELREDLKGRDPNWLLFAVEKACAFVEREQQEFERHWRQSRRRAYEVGQKLKPSL
jgi:Uncharacterized protein conserved in bacteria (DUF2252)